MVVGFESHLAYKEKKDMKKFLSMAIFIAAVVFLHYVLVPSLF